MYSGVEGQTVAPSDRVSDELGNANEVQPLEIESEPILPPSSFWLAYRGYIIAAAALFATLLVVAVSLGVSLTKDGTVDNDDNSIVNHDDYYINLDSTNTSAASLGRPNIIFILADDWGWNSVGHNNYDKNFSTPFLDSLAHKGYVLTNYYSQEICSPARTALLTGRYPVNVGMQFGVITSTEPYGMNTNEKIFPRVLSLQANYTTYGLGKWHLGHYIANMLPTARGFDHWVGYTGGQDYYWSKVCPSYTSYYDFFESTPSCYSIYNDLDMGNYSTYFYRDKAVNIISSHNYKANPMFLYLAAQAPHEPFTDLYTYQDGIPESYLGKTAYDQVVETVIGDKVQQYAMAMQILDSTISDIYDAVGSAGQLNNTYFIFASDNGGCAYAGGRNGPLRGLKGGLFEGGTKVDSFIYSELLPNSSVPNKTYNGLMHVSDWFPTLLTIANITNYTPGTGYSLDGYDQYAAIVGNTSSPRETMLYNLIYNVKGKGFNIWTNGSFAIRNERYKLLHYYVNTNSKYYSEYVAMPGDDDIGDTGVCNPSTTGNFTYFFFDLWEDPYETTNLYNNPAYDTIKFSLYDLVYQYMANSTQQLSPANQNSQAFSKWNAQNMFVQPWSDSLPSNHAIPTYCGGKNCCSFI